MDIDFVLDGGAYCTLSPVVLSRGTLHAAGPYFCPTFAFAAARWRRRRRRTGRFEGSARRRACSRSSGTWTWWPRAHGLAPDELRRRNFIVQGQMSAVGQVMREPVEMDALLDRALVLSDYHRKRATFDRGQRPAAASRRASVSRRSARRRLYGIRRGAPGVCRRRGGDAEGHVRVLAASTEIGQGTNTIFAQIIADTLGIEYDDVEVAQPDTANVPNSGPTVASRTAMVVGQTRGDGRTHAETDAGRRGTPRCRAVHRRRVHRRVPQLHRHARCRFAQGAIQPPPGMQWDDEAYRGDAYGAYAWAVYVAAVSVDTTTWETRIDDFVALQEIGRVLHPVLAAGQIEGGVAQAIGYALFEESRLARWPHGQRADDELHHAHVDGPAADPRVLRGTSLRARTVRRQGHRRAADGRRGAGDCQCDRPRDGSARSRQIPITPEVADGHDRSRSVEARIRSMS